ncbi:type IX secretion system membrane protein PorP/SprF [Ascidiimonas aurantiaca]|uniref:PorP/SprF family type IX secretion system membrane protein n=1 Tax=Ascidiimonas aurantiaca TaxID=1685432 RepID=UPI0030ED1B81
MNYTIKRYVILVFFMLTVTTQAQQDPDYVFYRYTMNAVNPAYAGSEGITSVVLNLRNQWQGVEDAPQTQTFFASTTLGEKLGTGLSIVNDQTFIEKQTAIYVDFSYKLQVSRETHLFLGLKAGGNFFDVNAGGLQTFNRTGDPLLTDQSSFNPNLGVGALLQHEKYFVSLSVPRLLNMTRFDEINGTVVEATDEVHIYLAGGYDFELSDEWLFKPSVMTRYVAGAPVSVNTIAAFSYDQKFEFGLAYRTDSALGGLALFKIANWLQAGYAYESSLRSEITEAASGTHELILRFFINTDN